MMMTIFKWSAEYFKSALTFITSCSCHSKSPALAGGYSLSYYLVVSTAITCDIAFIYGSYPASEYSIAPFLKSLG